MKIELIEHKRHELLACSKYVVYFYREKEKRPFQTSILTGSDLVFQNWPEEARYFLLPEVVKTNQPS